jgi:hypothetical protein
MPAMRAITLASVPAALAARLRRWDDMSDAERAAARADLDRLAAPLLPYLPGGRLALEHLRRPGAADGARPEEHRGGQA